MYSDELGFFETGQRARPTDRVLLEATLDLNRFLEPHIESMKKIQLVTKRLGPVSHRIAMVAEAERTDLIVMSPRRIRGIRRLLTGSITQKVTRMSPCPVLAVT